MIYHVGSFQLTDDLPVDAWNEITIYPGKNSYSFGLATDDSRFLAYSIHSPFNKIWASLSDDCPTDSSQFGYNLGLVNRHRVINTSQVLFVCSFNSQPVEAAVRASFFSMDGESPLVC